MSKYAPKSKVFNEEQLMNLKEAFKLLDKDGNGQLDASELSMFMNDCGLQAENAPLVISIFDTDHNGSISWDEFVNFMEVINSGDELALFRLLFKAMDTDNSGELSYDEVQRFFSYFNIQLTIEEAQMFISQFDTDKNGTLSFDEVMMALNKK